MTDVNAEAEEHVCPHCGASTLKKYTNVTRHMGPRFEDYMSWLDDKPFRVFVYPLAHTCTHCQACNRHYIIEQKLEWTYADW